MFNASQAESTYNNLPTEILERAALPYHLSSNTSTTSVFLTKITPPRLVGTLIERAELLPRLATWRRHRLTVIKAPAGYGKTTLAVLATQHTPQEATVVWLSLDETDNEPTQFLTCLIEAVASNLPILTKATTTAINQNQLQLAQQHLLNGIAQWGKPILFVMDDFHNIQKPAIHKMFAQIVERSPETLHWMLLTRRSVPFSLGKLRLQGQLLELDSNDLQFSCSEVAAFVKEFKHIELDTQSIDLLTAKTRGWIAGIHLSLLSLQYADTGGGAKDLSLYIRGDNRLHTEYLMGEVLSRQSETMRNFLLHCSILDRLHSNLCRAVTGEVESGQMLEQAVADQLFLRPLDVLGEWYELHHLFREMLQRQFRQLYSRDHLSSRYRAAADWFLAQDDISSALHILVHGEEVDLAASLLESHSRNAILGNRLTELRHWLHILPTAIVDARPRLLIDRAWLAAITDYNELREVMVHSEPIIDKLTNLPQPLQEDWEVLCFLKRLMSNDLQNLYVDVTETAKKMDKTNHLAQGYCHLMAALLAHQMNVSVREYHTTEADKEFSAIGFNFGSLLIAGLQAVDMMHTGRSDSALSICRGTELIFTDEKHPQFGDKEFFDHLAGEIHYWRNELAEAAISFQDAQKNAERENNGVIILRAQASLQLCDLALGRPVELTKEQVEYEQNIWQKNYHVNNDSTLATVVIWQMRRWLALGLPHEAWRAFQQLSISSETLPTYSADVLWIALLMAYVSNGYQLDKLTPTLDMMLERSRTTESIYLKTQLEILRVKQLYKLGSHHAARTTLRQVLHDVEQCGYIRMILDEPSLVPLLRAVQTQFAQTLLTKIEHPKQKPQYTSLTTQEMSILNMLLGGSGISDISDHLVITKGTVKWHLSNIYTKLGVRNQRQAVEVARRIGISHR